SGLVSLVASFVASLGASPPASTAPPSDGTPELVEPPQLKIATAPKARIVTNQILVLRMGRAEACAPQKRPASLFRSDRHTLTHDDEVQSPNPTYFPRGTRHACGAA